MKAALCSVQIFANEVIILHSSVSAKLDPIKYMLLFNNSLKGYAMLCMVLQNNIILKTIQQFRKKSLQKLCSCFILAEGQKGFNMKMD